MSELAILVTGASSGIGAAVCRRLAKPGNRLLIHARGGADGTDTAPLEAMASDIRERGAKAETIFADLAIAGAGERLVAATIQKFGALDQIVSNAGFADKRLLGDVDRATLDRSLSAMTGTFFEIATTAQDALKASKCGRVVAISSFAAHYYTSHTLFPVTAAAKAAVEALAKSLAVQLGPDGVTVNCVAPGYTQKDEGTHRAISPAALKAAANSALTGRIAQTDDIAAVVEFLLSSDAKQITGQVLRVDGGLGVT
ncbi:MAG TPA: SDR family oxidoreductase [Woeseiaceae bacterium]|nr:SDR family oxidoreductase [Woeseiaceae bacterium]